MKSVIIEKAGNYDQLLLKESEVPPIGADEVLIECRACGVNFADCCVRMGVYRSAKVYVGWPITPGFEIAGIIRKVGAQVSSVQEGDRVVAITRFGGYTSHLVVKEDQVFSLPNRILFEEGAAFPTIFLTAHYALEELSHALAGQTLLVHSAAGGVGSALVQLGKLAGCTVVGVVGSTEKVESVKALGADRIIDKSIQNLWKEAEEISPEGYDIILDANGPETLKESYKHLCPGGKLIVYGFHTMFSKGRGSPDWIKVIWNYLRTPRFNPMDMTTDNHSVLAFNLSYLFGKRGLLRKAMLCLLDLLEREKIRLPKITTYPLEKVADAHRDLESGKTIGKLVLIP